MTDDNNNSTALTNPPHWDKTDVFKNECLRLMAAGLFREEHTVAKAAVGQNYMKKLLVENPVFQPFANHYDRFRRNMVTTYHRAMGPKGLSDAAKAAIIAAAKARVEQELKDAIAHGQELGGGRDDDTAFFSLENLNPHSPASSVGNASPRHTLPSGNNLMTTPPAGTSTIYETPDTGSTNTSALRFELQKSAMKVKIEDEHVAELTEWVEKEGKEFQRLLSYGEQQSKDDAQETSDLAKAVAKSGARRDQGWKNASATMANRSRRTDVMTASLKDHKDAKYQHEENKLKLERRLRKSMKGAASSSKVTEGDVAPVPEKKDAAPVFAKKVSGKVDMDDVSIASKEEDVSPEKKATNSSEENFSAFGTGGALLDDTDTDASGDSGHDEQAHNTGGKKKTETKAATNHSSLKDAPIASTGKTKAPAKKEQSIVATGKAKVPIKEDSHMSAGLIDKPKDVAAATIKKAPAIPSKKKDATDVAPKKDNTVAAPTVKSADATKKPPAKKTIEAPGKAGMDVASIANKEANTVTFAEEDIDPPIETQKGLIIDGVKLISGVAVPPEKLTYNIAREFKGFDPSEACARGAYNRHGNGICSGCEKNTKWLCTQYKHQGKILAMLNKGGWQLKSDVLQSSDADQEELQKRLKEAAATKAEAEKEKKRHEKLKRAEARANRKGP